MGNRKVICALDTSDLNQALDWTKKLAPYVGAFKVGHALTLPYGLDVLARLRDAGAERIFLDLKFHDIPNSVGLAVRTAARHGVWMLTIHTAGGPAMITAAAEEAKSYGDVGAPLVVGVSVLTSLDQHTLTDHLGIQRSIEDHMTYMAQLAVDCGIDGVVCSPHEVSSVRNVVRHAVIVTPGIRLPNHDTNDQTRVGSATQALADGADYLVIGRPLTGSNDPVASLEALGLESAAR